MVLGKWLKSQTWVRYINKNHPIKNSSLVDTVTLNHAVSYDPTLLYLYHNEKWTIRRFINILLKEITSLLSNTITFEKRVRQGMTINWRHAVFCLSSSTTPLPINLAWDSSLKAVMKKLIPNMIGPKIPTSKKVADPDVETIDSPGGDSLQDFVS